MNFYTFGLKYPDGTVEEIDVTARTYPEARREAQRIAQEGYLPGWTIVDLPPGGSGGLIVRYV